MKFNFKDIKSNFDDIPTDRYNVEIAKMEEAKSAQKGTPMLKVQYKILDGDHKNRIIFDQFVLQQNSLWKLKMLMKAAKSNLLEKECEEKQIIKELVGKKISVYVETAYNEQFDRVQSSCSNYAEVDALGVKDTGKKTAAFE